MRMTANKRMGGIRGKDRVNGPRKPKKRGSKPDRPTWPTSPWKERGMAKVETKWAIWAETFVWTMLIP